MTFTGYVTSAADATNELLDTEAARSLSAEYQISFPSSFVFTLPTDEADAICKDAGLNVDFPGLLDAAKSVGKWPPGVLPPFPGEQRKHRPDYWLKSTDRLHLLIRAWAKLHAPTLIDPAAIPRSRPEFAWW